MPTFRSHVVDEEETIYREDLSDFSDDDSIISLDELRTRREFRLPKEDGLKPVYEAWHIRLPVQKDREVVKTTTNWKLLGATVLTKDSVRAQGPRHFLSRPVDAEQSELANMHLGALEQFQAAHRRGWAARVLGSKPKTYEADLDKRCRNLPLQIQEVINDILDRRGRQSSTKYRDRRWTVAVMQEQAFRFSMAEKSPVEKKAQFWKSATHRSTGEVTYFIVIRGVETKVCEDAQGFTEVCPHGNPWLEADRADYRLKARDRRIRLVEERRKRRCTSPSFYSDWDVISTSSDSNLDERRSRSPPSYRTRRDCSPASNPDEEQARQYIRHTRNSLPTVPMAPSRAHAGPALTPAWAFPPVSEQHMTDNAGMPLPPPRYPSPAREDLPSQPVASQPGFVSAPSPTLIPPAPRPIVIVDTFPSFRSTTLTLSKRDNSRPYTVSTISRPRSECEGCLVTVPCDHFNGPTCDRPLRAQQVNGSPQYSHPPCFICMAKGLDTGFTSEAAAFADSRPRAAPTRPVVTEDVFAVPSLSTSETAGSSPPIWPPRYSPCEQWRRHISGDDDTTTDIDSDDDSDEEATAVADSPKPGCDE